MRVSLERTIFELATSLQSLRADLARDSCLQVKVRKKPNSETEDDVFC